MADAGPRYWAFLSYSHQDVRWARWLHRQLEGYVVPRRLVGHATPAGPAPRRFRPIFRDRDELGASARLSHTLEDALRDSEWLIVVCSPAAAHSAWVTEEIRRFRLTHGEERILAVIADGEPLASDQPGGAARECFPQALRAPARADGADRDDGFEPAAADLRPGQDSRRGALLKLVAGMLGTSLDKLVQRDARRRHRQLLAITAASVAISAALGALAVTAFAERNEAVAQRGQAEGLIEFMVGDLRRTLEPAGRLDALDAIGGRALAYYAAQRRRGLDAASLGRRARVLHLLGDIRATRGDLPGALALFSQAADSTGELLARRPRDPQRIFDHAQSVYWVGYVAFERGQNDIARARFTKYVELADDLVAIDPKNADWRAEVGEAETDLGDVTLREGRPDEAAAAYAKALAISARLAALSPGRRDRQWDEAQDFCWLADAEVRRGRLDAAEGDRTRAAAIYAALVERAPADSAAVVAQAANRTAIASIMMTRGDLTVATADLTASADKFDLLIRAAPDNVDYKDKASPTYLLLGRALLEVGRLQAADGVARKALAMSQSEARAGRGIGWLGPALGGARVLSMRIAAARAATPAGQTAALAPAPAEADRLAALARAHPRNARLADLTAEAMLLAGDYQRAKGDLGEARASWTNASAPLSRAGTASAPAGRAAVILRERAFRLSYGRPPVGSLSNGTPAMAGLHGRADYRW